MHTLKTLLNEHLLFITTVILLLGYWLANSFQYEWIINKGELIRAWHEPESEKYHQISQFT